MGISVGFFVRSGFYDIAANDYCDYFYALERYVDFGVGLEDRLTIARSFRRVSLKDRADVRSVDRDGLFRILDEGRYLSDVRVRDLVFGAISILRARFQRAALWERLAAFRASLTLVAESNFYALISAN